MIEKVKTIIDYARSHQASSVVAGLACAAVGAMLYTGASQTAAFAAGAAILLIGVPVANAIR